MITAQPSLVAKKLLSQYFRHRLTSHFYAGYIRGESGLHAWLHSQERQTTPTIFFATHNNWWDAIMAIDIAYRQCLIYNTYGVMEYKQLLKYSLFTRLGMFSIVRDNPQSAMQSLRYATSLLKGTNNTLWMFPQGELVHAGKRPLGFYPGLGILSRMLQTVALVPVVFSYQYRQEERPESFVDIGTPILYTPQKKTILGNDVRSITATCETALTSMVETHYAELENTIPISYSLHFKGATSIEKRLDKIFGR